jgi:CHAD domain-containing protein
MSEVAPERPTAAAVPARPPLIDDQTSPDEACRVVLFECLTHVSANVEPVKAGDSPEALHQLRVGMRRLRVALGMFGQGAAGLDALNLRAKTFLNGFGPARDLDVFLDELFAPAIAHMEPQHGFDVLKARATRERTRLWNVAAAEVASPDFAKFQDEVAAAARTHTWPVDGPLSAFAAPLLDEVYRKARKRGTHFKDRPAHERHRLRIAMKKLRYGSEFFAPLYDAKKVRDFVDPLKELQDLLGHLNDVAQVRSVLARLMMTEAADAHAELSHAAGLIQGWHQARAERVSGKAAKRWKKFKQAETFWR